LTTFGQPSVELARQKRPNLLIDGEFQIDSAILPKVASKKIRGNSQVAGRANILVFPNLGAGNIGIKIAQIFAGAIAYGPMLQGFSKPVTDFSRSAPLDEIVGNLAMLVVRAGDEK
jgi:phosphate acetyltransferase